MSEREVTVYIVNNRRWTICKGRLQPDSPMLKLPVDSCKAYLSWRDAKIGLLSEALKQLNGCKEILRNVEKRYYAVVGLEESQCEDWVESEQEGCT